ncbi:MAG: cysteine desulfurase-like protein, partial [Chloroflexi bacterium]|nr:cysteine desulfurase-like protein [Chloroflexota bacterium]
MTLDPTLIRAQFPALASGAIFFDNPGGTQVPRRVVERMADYLTRTNANHGGAFRTSVESDAMLHEAHAAMADFLGAASPDEIIFGANMTTLTFALSRALGRWLAPGDEIVVTRLDHDGDIAPWLLVAEDRGAVVKWVDIREEDCTLDMADFEAQISDRTKIVAVGYASNAVGTINDVKTIVEMAHAAGALAFVDAVQYAPHGPTDVRALDCDFLACSAYKFFGPHVGVMYGKRDLLDRLPAYKVRPAENTPPGKFETGTQNHEGIAGTLGALEYIAWVGETFGAKSQTPNPKSRRQETLMRGMTAIREYEKQLGARLIAGLRTIPGLKIWGITDPARYSHRVPTVSFTLDGWHPRQIA